MSKKPKDEDEDELKAAALKEPTPSVFVDDGELTAAEKLELEAEARAEVQKALKATKKKDFKQAAKDRFLRETLFRSGKDATGEDILTVNVDLASHPKYIILDGTVYHSGRAYKVKRGVAAVLLDQMDRGWRQEAARLGERTDYVAQQQKTLSRQGLRVH